MLDGAPILSGADRSKNRSLEVTNSSPRGILLVLNGYVALSDTARGARAPIAMDMELGGAAQNFVGPRRWVMALIDRRFVVCCRVWSSVWAAVKGALESAACHENSPLLG